MEVRVSQKDFNEALQLVSRAADPKNTLPIVGNILLRTDKDKLVVSATNLEIAITHHIPAKITKEGSTTVPAKITSDFVSSLPNDEVELRVDGQSANISSGTYSSRVNSLQADEFPSLPAVERKNRLALDPLEFKRALEQTVFAASGDEGRPVLTAVLMKAAKDKTIFAATDSYRLAEKTLDSSSGAEQSVLLPASSMQDLLRIIAKHEDEPVDAYLSGAQAVFVVGDTELITRLIDGNYPEYEGLIPDKSLTTFTMKKDELLRLTKVAALFARESAGSIAVDVSEGEETVHVNSIASQVGQNSSHAKAIIEGPSAKITLNSRFLIDALGAIGSDEVNFSFSEALKPIVIEPAGKNAETNYRHIIMPLKG